MLNWIKDKLIPPYKLNSKEQLILDIITSLCENSDTEIKMAPLTGRYFLVNKRFQYWIRIWEDGITITNHKFTFTHMAPLSYQAKLKAIVETAIEKSRDEFENAVFRNEVELLQSISSSITDTKV